MHIPPDLREADNLLAQYGRWARDRARAQHCGSVEYRYVHERGDTDGRREAPEPMLPEFRAEQVQRALIRVPLQYRKVLQAEYIPQRMPLAKIRRLSKIPAMLWRITHLEGLRMFTNQWRLLHSAQTLA